MKLRTLGLVALVATLGLASCKKEEGPQVDQQPKAVAVNLDNVIDAVTKGMSLPVTDKDKVDVKNFQIIFTDGTKLYYGKNVNGTQETHYYTSLADYNQTDADEPNLDNTTGVNDRIYHFLPSAVNKVIVVGNYGDPINIEAEATDTYAELKTELNKNYAVAEQQATDNLDLYGEAALTAVVGEDKLGHPLYKATVELAPRVSRMEIIAFEYIPHPEATPLEGELGYVDGTTPKPGEADFVTKREFTNITVEQVVFNGYYSTADVVTADAATWNLKANTDLTEATIFKYFSDMEALGTNIWYNDMLTNVKLDETADFKKSYGDTEERPAYNFFPKGDQITNTQLVIKLSGTKDGNKTALYLKTNGFTPALDQDIADVYKVNFQFSDKDLKDPEKCVLVTVTVDQWVQVNVTPNFQ